MRMNNGGQVSRYALDANLPLLRPDSVVRKMTEGLWGLYTPSCWPDREEGTLGWVLGTGTEEQLVAELKSLGDVDKSENGIEYRISKIILDPEWWIHRAEDGMIPAEILEGKV